MPHEWHFVLQLSYQKSTSLKKTSTNQFVIFHSSGMIKQTNLMSCHRFYKIDKQLVRVPMKIGFLIIMLPFLNRSKIPHNKQVWLLLLDLKQILELVVSPKHNDSSIAYLESKTSDHRHDTWSCFPTTDGYRSTNI